MKADPIACTFEFLDRIYAIANSHSFFLLLLFVTSVLEYWFGKTKLVKSGSIFEFLFSLPVTIIRLLGKIKTRKDPKL